MCSSVRCNDTIVNIANNGLIMELVGAFSNLRLCATSAAVKSLYFRIETTDKTFCGSIMHIE
jgi:hypothetical protein